MIGTYSQDTVTWIQFQGLDEYGDPLEPVEVPLSSRVDWAVKRVVSHSGEEVISSGSVRMLGRPKAGEDKIRISGTDHIIVAVHEMKSFSRVSHYKAFVQ